LDEPVEYDDEPEEGLTNLQTPVPLYDLNDVVKLKRKDQLEALAESVSAELSDAFPGCECTVFDWDGEEHVMYRFMCGDTMVGGVCKGDYPFASTSLRRSFVWPADCTLWPTAANEPF